MLNKKVLIAPILAIALVLSLTAAVSYLPLSPQTAPKNQFSTVSTPALTSTPKPTLPSYSAGASSTQMPSPAPAPTAPPTSAPTAVPAVVSQPVYFLPVLCVIVALVVGVVAVQVLFREKELRKELSEGE